MEGCGKKKCQYKDLKVEMGLTYSKKKKKANIAGGQAMEEFKDKGGGGWGATQYKPGLSEQR